MVRAAFQPSAPPFTPLACGQVVATGALIAALRFAPPSLNTVWVCFFLFNGIRFLNVVRHHWFTGPLVPARIAAPGGGN